MATVRTVRHEHRNVGEVRLFLGDQAEGYASLQPHLADVVIEVTDGGRCRHGEATVWSAIRDFAEQMLVATNRAVEAANARAGALHGEEWP